jgi:hypothetical protein
MTPLNYEELEAAAQKLIDYHHQAQASNNWTFFVDEMYDKDCTYQCEYAGTMDVTARGIEEIKATHYGRDMQKGWEGWTFPYLGIYLGKNNKVITHWMNRGPGKKKDGTHFETPGVSYITFNAQGKICRQLDLFDLAHQMRLCDELNDYDLLSEELNENWVKPMKRKLMAMLTD